MLAANYDGGALNFPEGLQTDSSSFGEDSHWTVACVWQHASGGDDVMPFLKHHCWGTPHSCAPYVMDVWLRQKSARRSQNVKISEILGISCCIQALKYHFFWNPDVFVCAFTDERAAVLERNRNGIK